MTGGTTRRLADDNDAAALKWAGPFGYAVLETLRRSDVFAEADFAAFMDRTPGNPMAHPSRVNPVEALTVAQAARREYLNRQVPRQVTMSEAGPTAVPDFLGDPPPGSSGRVLEPPPPPEFYKRVTRPNTTARARTQTQGRPAQPAAPAGKRDASGRYIRPAR